MHEVYNECSENLGELESKMKFLVEIKKENPEVTLLDARKFLGYYNEDKKKDVTLASKFNSEVFHPLRNFISKQLLNLQDSEVESMWGRSASEELKAMRSKVNEYLPKRTRTTTQKVLDMSFLGLNFTNNEEETEDYNEE